MVLDGLYMYIVYIYKYNFKTKMLLAKNIRHRYVLFTPLRVGWPPTPQVYFGP